MSSDSQAPLLLIEVLVGCILCIRRIKHSSYTFESYKNVVYMKAQMSFAFSVISTIVTCNLNNYCHTVEMFSAYCVRRIKHSSYTFESYKNVVYVKAQMSFVSSVISTIVTCNLNNYCHTVEMFSAYCVRIIKHSSYTFESYKITVYSKLK